MATLAGVLVFLGGLIQYRRAQQWERAKFVAEEMKAFLADARVQRANTMIDWANRYVNLYNSAEPDWTQWPFIQRRDQTAALMPYTMPGTFEQQAFMESRGHGLSDDASRAAAYVKYKSDLAAIRDCFDAWLDGFEKFGSYLETGLLSKRDLAPYLEYWVADIYALPVGRQQENEWSAALLSYADFYGYTNFQLLCERFDRPVGSTSKRYKEFMAQMTLVDSSELLALCKAERENRRKDGNAE